MQLTTRYVGYQLAKTRRQTRPQSNNHRTHTAFNHFKTIVSGEVWQCHIPRAT